MMRPTNLGGSFTLGKTSLTVNRVGYGAMQLAGPAYGGCPRTLTVPSPFFARPSLQA
jgi:pyridoxine 4-dehydrogenase